MSAERERAIRGLVEQHARKYRRSNQYHQRIEEFTDLARAAYDAGVAERDYEAQQRERSAYERGWEDGSTNGHAAGVAAEREHVLASLQNAVDARDADATSWSERGEDERAYRSEKSATELYRAACAIRKGRHRP